jgi:hypothetical protein
MNNITAGLWFICLGFCFLFFYAVKTVDLLNTGSVSDTGYCTPLVVTCKDKTQFLGAAVSREDRVGKTGARQCDFVSPGKNKTTRGEVWAQAVCHAHGGIAEVQRPFFYSYSKLLPLINAQEATNPALYGALMRKNRMGPDNAQAVYDEFVRRTIGEYYLPIPTPENVHNDETQE